MPVHIFIAVPTCNVHKAMFLNAFVKEVDQNHPSSRTFWRGCMHAADILHKVQAANRWGNTHKDVPCANLTATEVHTKNNY